MMVAWHDHSHFQNVGPIPVSGVFHHWPTRDDVHSHQGWTEGEQEAIAAFFEEKILPAARELEGKWGEL